MACKKEHRTKVNFWNLFLNVVSIYKNQLFMMEQNERIIEIMTTSFQELLDEAKAQGAQLDKVLAEVQEGNASAVTPEQLDELKSVLDANQGKLQNIDDAHPDKAEPSQPVDGSQPTESTPARGESSQPSLPEEPAAPTTGDAGQVSP